MHDKYLVSSFFLFAYSLHSAWLSAWHLPTARPALHGLRATTTFQTGASTQGWVSWSPRFPHLTHLPPALPSRSLKPLTAKNHFSLNFFSCCSAWKNEKSVSVVKISPLFPLSLCLDLGFVISKVAYPSTEDFLLYSNCRCRFGCADSEEILLPAEASQAFSDVTKPVSTKFKSFEVFMTPLSLGLWAKHRQNCHLNE